METDRNDKHDTFDIITIDRHRLYTDGKGVTTLIILSGCPFYCRYCINRRILSGGKVKRLTVNELVQLAMQDYCCFTATGGGISERKSNCIICTNKEKNGSMY